MSGAQGPLRGWVVEWDEEAGTGSVMAAELPSPAFVHAHSVIQSCVGEYIQLLPSEPVTFSYEELEGERTQDGYRFRVIALERDPQTWAL